MSASNPTPGAWRDARMLSAALGDESSHGMSDTSQGPGWWLASDGKWYPPELWTGPPNTNPWVAKPADRRSQRCPVSRRPARLLVTRRSRYRPSQRDRPGEPGSPGQAPPYGANAWPVQPPLGPAHALRPTAGRALRPTGVRRGGRSSTNGLAIASLICSIVGLFFITPSWPSSSASWPSPDQAVGRAAEG